MERSNEHAARSDTQEQASTAQSAASLPIAPARPKRSKFWLVVAGVALLSIVGGATLVWRQLSLMKKRETIELVWIPPGSFMMGAESSNREERPVHPVTIKEGFYMSKYEVTQAQWQAVMNDDSDNSYYRAPELPVEQLPWNNVRVFIRKLNERHDGFEYRLPTEAEWEYAARAGTTGDYAGDLDAIAWYGNNSGRAPLDAAEIARTNNSNYLYRLDDNGNKPHPVGQKQANAFGLYDMEGNVSEWCQDVYHENYTGAPADGSAWLTGGKEEIRMTRGGSWASPAFSCRTAYRGHLVASSGGTTQGLRLVAVKHP